MSPNEDPTITPVLFELFDDSSDNEGSGSVMFVETEGTNDVVHTYSSLLLMSSNNISLSIVLS
jgi:hypothetical protein